MDNGQWASRKQIEGWVSDAVAMADSGTDELARMIGDVQIDSRSWETSMRQQILEAYKQQYMLGKGGIEQMTAQDWGSIGGMVADQYRYLDRFAQQIADGLLSEGGKGSGWFAPPKGTHGPGSQGGRFRYVEQPTDEQIARWEKQTADWDAPRGGMAYAALHSIRSYSGVAAIFIEEGSELKGIGSISTPEGERRMNAWRLAPYEPDLVVVASFMGTKERGYGLAMMQGLADVCIENGWELRFGSIPTSDGFFRAIGMKPVHDTAYRLSPEELRAWRATFSEVTREEAAAAEPADGIFIVQGFIEGGPGSGWFAPPKGTHGIGSQGGPVRHAPGQPQLPGMPPQKLQPSPSEMLTDFEDAVINGNVTWEGGELYGGVTRPTEIEVETPGGDRFTATFKEHHGDAQQFHDAYSERAAYELAVMLNPDLDVAQECVLADYEGMNGTYHKWIDGVPGRSSGSGGLDDVLTGPEAQDRLETILALDVIIHNTDRHDGNWIVGDDGNLYAIDHGHAVWSEWRSGGIAMSRSVAWEGFWYDIEVPGVTHTKEERQGYTRNVLHFTFREETLNRWRNITMGEFIDTIEPTIIAAEDRYGRYGTRVNIESAWSNFRKLLDYGEITNVK